MAAHRPADPSIARLQADVEQAANTLLILTQGAVDTLDGVCAASVTVASDSEPFKTLAPTDPVAERLDELQYQLREGPCYEAATRALSIDCDDLARDTRWPTYGPAAERLGVAAQMSFRVGTMSCERMALNLYARSSGPFSTDRRLVALFVSHVALVTGHLRLEQQLTQALSSRKVIGQAIGITMASYALDEQRGFDYLVRQSQSRNIKLKDVCAELVENQNLAAEHGPSA